MRMHANIVSYLGTLLVLLLIGLTPVHGFAQSQNPGAPTNPVVNNSTPAVADTCTNFTARAALMQNQNGNVPASVGIMSDIYTFITGVVNDATRKLFLAFTDDPTYRHAVYGAITLMVVFYGVAFMIGIVQPSFQQVLIRLVKIGFIFTLISPTGWLFFSEYIVTFFQNGTDDIIRAVQGIAGIPAPAGATPFYALDRIADFIIQPDTIIAIMGAIGAGGPYGLSMGGLMLIAMAGFLRLLLVTLQTYAITFVARALVLGVAPIFFIFLLFDRTKNMFVAWLNALINLSLQPILLFTFLSFFIIMIQTASKDMLKSELCWGDFKIVVGSTTTQAFWRFQDPVTHQPSASDYTYMGSLECLISPHNVAIGPSPCPEFPIPIVGILSFLILVFIAGRFTEVVKRISSELSNALVGLDSSGKMEQFLRSQNEGSGVTLNRNAGDQPTRKTR